MFNWLKKLFGREHKVTVDGAQFDRMQRAATPQTAIERMADHRARLAAGYGGGGASGSWDSGSSSDSSSSSSSD